MHERHLLTIPLPHGRTDDAGRLTVYFSPRLRETAPLSQYPEWQRWGAWIDHQFALGNIEVHVDGAPVSFTRVGPMVDPAVWPAVFADDTPVRGHRATKWDEFAQKRLLIGPGGDFSEAVLRYYAAMAATHPDVPPSGEAALDLPQAHVLTSEGAKAATEYVKPMEGERMEEIADPGWDFHQYVSILGHHPELLRLLGLAVELEVDLPASPSDVRVAVADYDDGGLARLVQFRMETTPDFWARPNPDPTYTEQEGGFLILREADESLDGLLTILDTGSSADRLRGLETRLPGHGGALPALRTRALTLVQQNLVNAYRNRTERQWKLEGAIDDLLAAAQPTPIQIFAEDATIGHRIDVYEPASKDGVWRSLFERRTDDAGYHFPIDEDLDRTPKPDEGWTTLTLVTELQEPGPPENPDGPEPYVPEAIRRIDENLYRWDGWSGAARPPGGTADGATGELMPAQPLAPPVGDPVQFAAHYEVVPGSLPRLRFGTTYLMRARCVDLSGDSRPLYEPEPQSALPDKETFGRLEPISGPFVVRRLPRPVPGIGDEATTVVLRSDYDVEDNTIEPDERLLFPGQVGQDLCELHGLPEGGLDPLSWGLLADRDRRDPHGPWDTDPVTGEGVAGGPRRQHVRYLADPMVGNLRAYHYAAREERLAATTGSWPELTSSRVVVLAGDRSIDANTDELTDLKISVAKADIDAIDLSYAMTEGGLEQFGLWHQLTMDDQGRLRGEIERGAHWMFSARTSLRVVHAVRRPLLPPRATDWTIDRLAHSTGVILTSASFEIDRRSTGRLTMAARWTDQVDDVRTDGPEPRAGGAPLGNVDTPRASGEEFVLTKYRSELGDTRRHLATIDLEAFSSFSDYFTEERAVTIGDAPVIVDERGIAAGTAQVTTADGVIATAGLDFAIDGPAGTLAHLGTGLLKPGVDVNVRYVPLPVSRTNDEPEMKPFEVLFPSTAAPPPPTVVEVVPAFARSSDGAQGNGAGPSDKQFLEHDGNVVRVYLARPWNVSGDGECIAVLVEAEPSGVPRASCVGRDPIVAGTTTPLEAGAFPRATSVVRSDDGAHDLALHEVHYDGSTKRWFVDIAVDTPMYRPFLRLSLARYQPDAIDGEHLSSPVEMEPLRLGVRRIVAMRTVGTHSYEVTVTGTDHGGMTATSTGDDLLVNEMVVTHQRADERFPDDDLRWLIDVKTVSLTRVANGSASIWSGKIDAPPDGSPARLVIEEREPAFVGGSKPVVDSEVVYTETVPLPT